MNKDTQGPATGTTPCDTRGDTACDTPAEVPVVSGTEAQAGSVPAGFEEFDLDDIEVVESKVFA